MAITVNVGGKNKTAPKVETVEQETAVELTLEERLVAAIGEDKMNKAAQLATDIQSKKDDLAALESDYKPIMDEVKKILKDENIVPSKKLVLKSEGGAVLTVAAEKKGTTIKDKEKLYHALEEVQEGLFFELSKVGLTDAKAHIPVKGNPEIFKEGYTGCASRALKFKF